MPDGLVAALRGPRGLLILGVLLALAGVLLALPAVQLHRDAFHYSGEALQLAFDSATLERVLSPWSARIPGTAATGFALQREILFPGDTLLPVGYGLGFFGLLTLLAGPRPPGWVDRLRWLPIAAMILDLVENQLMGLMLARGEAGIPIPAALPLVTSLVAVAKYATISGLTPAVGLTRLGRRLREGGPRPRWILAGLALLVPLAFAVRAARVGWALHFG